MSFIIQAVQGAVQQVESAQQRAADYKSITYQGKIAEREQIQQDLATSGKAEAAAAASGLDPGEGTPLEIMIQNSRTMQKNAARIQYQTRLASGPDPEKQTTMDKIEMFTNWSGRYPFGPASMASKWLGIKGHFKMSPWGDNLAGQAAGKGLSSLSNKIAARREAAINSRADFTVNNMPSGDWGGAGGGDYGGGTEGF